MNSNFITFSLLLVQKDATDAIMDMKQHHDFSLVRVRAIGKLGEKDSPYGMAIIISDSLIVEKLFRNCCNIQTKI